jgi:hypothetical protein
MAEARGPATGKRVAGVALMLLGVALIGYGTHYLTKNGNCSSTGYVSYGPVPRCGGGEALYITSTFFLGPALAVVGWLMAQAWGVLWPAVCVSVGTGMLTLRADATAATGARSFGLAAGLVFFALAVLSVLLTVRKRRRPKPVPHGLGGLTARPAGAAAGHVPGAPAAAPSGPAGGHPAEPAGPDHAGPAAGADPLDRIAKLARLRDSGALTNEEFEAQKAKLLAEM